MVEPTQAAAQTAQDRAHSIIENWRQDPRGVRDYDEIENDLAAALTAAANDMRERCAQRVDTFDYYKIAEREELMKEIADAIRALEVGKP